MGRDTGPVQCGGAVLDRDGAGLVLDASAVSISGPRAENQDAAFAGPRLLAVADGVGGNVGGAVAAALALGAVTGELEGRQDVGAAALSAAVATASDRLRSAVAADPGLAGMATTLTTVALAGSDLAVAHVGDCRAYLLRGAELQQLTHDHTVVQSLVDAGVIGADEARTHPLSSIVLGVLHGRDDDLAHVDVSTVSVRPEDRLLVCSDGLSGVVGAETLGRILGEERRPGDAATRLVRAALAAGTHDNVTAVVADVRAVPEQADRGAGAGTRTVPVVVRGEGSGYTGWLSAAPPTS